MWTVVPSAVMARWVSDRPPAPVARWPWLVQDVCGCGWCDCHWCSCGGHHRGALEYVYPLWITTFMNHKVRRGQCDCVQIPVHSCDIGCCCGRVVAEAIFLEDEESLIWHGALWPWSPGCTWINIWRRNTSDPATAPALFVRWLQLSKVIEHLLKDEAHQHQATAQFDPDDKIC